MKIQARARRRSASGFTLIEILITASLMSMVIGSVVMVARSNDNAYRSGVMTSELEARVANAVERVVAELQTAVFDSLDPDPGNAGIEQIEYVHATGMTGGNVDESSLRRLAFEYAIGEVDDGLDNNGNGLIDEGRLILTENAGEVDERRLVLTRWVAERLAGETQNGLDDNGNGLVDESGFVVERAGETLVVHLTVQRRDAGGLLMTRTARTSVRLRN
jgi:hypothetical protein